MKKLVNAIATFFGIGYIPVAQGTVASLAGVGIYFLTYYNIIAYLATTSLCIIAGFLVCGRAEESFGKKDPGQIVIDEVAGMLVAYLFIPFTTPYVIIGFVLYRLLDIFKIYPINKLESLPRSAGIMSDDLAAGILTNIALQVIIYTKIGIC